MHRNNGWVYSIMCRIPRIKRIRIRRIRHSIQVCDEYRSNNWHIWIRSHRTSAVLSINKLDSCFYFVKWPSPGCIDNCNNCWIVCLYVYARSMPCRKLITWPVDGRWSFVFRYALRLRAFSATVTPMQFDRSIFQYTHHKVTLVTPLNSTIEAPLKWGTDNGTTQRTFHS